MSETQRTLFVVLILAASITAAVFSFRAFQLRGKVFWAVSFVTMSAGGIIWLLSNAARLMSQTDTVWKFSAYVAEIGIALGTFGAMIFSVQITNRTRRIPRLLLTLFIPLIVIFSLLTWTNDFHHWVWVTMQLPGQSENVEGPAYIALLIAFYSQVAVAVWVLLRSYLKQDGIFRAQTGLLLVGLFFPLLFGVMEDVLGLDLLYGVDEAALATLVTIGVFAVVTLRFGTFSIVPVAYKLMVDSMEEGLIVLDLGNQVVTANPAAARMLNDPQMTRRGTPFHALLARWSTEAQTHWSEGKRDFEVHLDGDVKRSYRFSTRDLVENQSESAGKMVMIYDITKQKLLEANLHEMAINDPLTGCFNRGHFLECAGKQFRQAQRYHRPLSVALIDLDNFKRVNDEFGHSAGDRVLKRVVAACLANLRRSDLFARYGGEEFVLLMPETEASDAVLVAERLREAINGQFYQGVSVTASIGVAPLDIDEPIELDRLLDRADQAQYRSKELGRDRVTLWKK